ncbi:YxeA family protein [Paenibacillus sp. MWE-103]|uniref:YxeA family protein n=1 Tax=Paenibacillus artemisiicola TaxID=1172618 RepID=A0ABS3W7X1_9BACL|nr:YxeA family protein [Paenibacillus artemisiicola]MBO7744407.1 YxeA family protein [Paenibacillus artemisiicola]
MKTKKKAKIVSLTAVVLVITILAVLFVMKYRDVVDRFNPFLTKEFVFVQINHQGKPEPQGRVAYELTGFSAGGMKKKVKFTASTQLPIGTYLKVLAKGAYTQEYEKINEEALPEAMER